MQFIMLVINNVKAYEKNNGYAVFFYYDKFQLTQIFTSIKERPINTPVLLL